MLENDGECIMIHGGRTVNNEILNDTWMLDARTWMWTQVSLINFCVACLYNVTLIHVSVIKLHVSIENEKHAFYVIEIITKIT